MRRSWDQVLRSAHCCSRCLLDIKYCFTIKPDVFIPKPKVESAIVKFSKKEHALIDEKNMFDLINLYQLHFHSEENAAKHFKGMGHF